MTYVMKIESEGGEAEMLFSEERLRMFHREIDGEPPEAPITLELAKQIIEGKIQKACFDGTLIMAEDKKGNLCVFHPHTLPVFCIKIKEL